MAKIGRDAQRDGTGPNPALACVNADCAAGCNGCNPLGVCRGTPRCEGSGVTGGVWGAGALYDTRASGAAGSVLRLSGGSAPLGSAADVSGP